MRHPRTLLVQTSQYTIRKDLPLKIPPVQRLPEDRLIKLLQLRQRKLPGKQIITQRLIVQLRLQGGQRRRQDLIVVQDQWPPLLQIIPVTGIRKDVGPRHHLREFHQRIKAYADEPLCKKTGLLRRNARQHQTLRPRIGITPERITKHAELLQKNILQPRTLPQGPACRLFQRLVLADKTARQSPLLLMLHLQQQDLQLPRMKSKDNTVERNMGQKIPLRPLQKIL